MSIRDPVQTAACPLRALGALKRVIADQLSVEGLYLLSVAVGPAGFDNAPPHTSISLPVQTAVWNVRPVGAPAVLVASQVSALGSYRPPVEA